MDLLNAKLIEKKIQVSPQPQIHVFGRLLSTQTYCLKHRLAGHQIVVANEQSQGRGQRGHRFYSPQSSGIYMTIVLPAAKRFVRNPGILTAGVGLAVAQASSKFTRQPVGLKWMNDLESRQRKYGGILVETVSNAVNQIQSWLIGIGLNLKTRHFPGAIRQRAGNLSLARAAFSRNQVISAIYNRLLLVLHTDSAAIVAGYQKRLIWRGRRVTFYLAGKQKSGIILGIDQKARLMVRGQDNQVYHLNYQNAEQIRLA